MSSFVRLQNLSFAYENQKEKLFDQISIDLNPGWSAICGPNGCGKTTLFRLISGELKPDQGSVWVHGLLEWVPQSTVKAPAALSDFRYSWGRMATGLKVALGIEESWYDCWESLSPGERKRLQTAVALSQNPDILLVDEPGNHLDFDSKKVIIDALRAFKGTGIMISHDRQILNSLCSRTLFLSRGTCSVFDSSWEGAKDELERVEEQQKREKRNLGKQLAKNLRTVRQQAEKVDAGKKKLSKKGLAKKDHDSREKVNRARLTGADFADGRKKKVSEGKADRLSRQIGSIHIQKKSAPVVNFDETLKVRRVHLPEQTVNGPGFKIRHPEITLEKGETLAVTGANGCGKTTLLKHWLTLLPDPFTYGPQELSSEKRTELFRDLKKLRKEEWEKLLVLVKSLGSSPVSLTEDAEPSPGVWQKIIIAHSVIKRVPLLILDEPTNHMDLDAVLALEKALISYEGIVILVSHDRDFVERTATKELIMKRTDFETHGILKL